MSLSTLISSQSFIPNGSTTVFAYPFRILVDSDLEVYLRTIAGVEQLQTITTDYTVSGVGDATGGNVTFLTAPDNVTHDKILTRRKTPQTQTLVLPDGGDIPSANLEQRLDRAIMLVQEVEETLSRIPTLKRTTALTDLVLPEPGAGQFFQWNAGGTQIVTSEIKQLATSGIAISTFMEDTLDEANSDDFFDVLLGSSGARSLHLRSQQGAFPDHLSFPDASAKIYQTLGSGSFPFAELGNLILQPRIGKDNAGDARDIMFTTGHPPVVRAVMDRNGRMTFGGSTVVNNGTVSIKQLNAADSALAIRGAVASTATLIRVENSSGDFLFSVDNGGEVVVRHRVDAVAMDLKAHTTQTLNVLQVKDSADQIQFGIEGDGDIRTNRTAAGTTLGSVARKWEIFNANGTSLGFLPLYDSIT